MEQERQQTSELGPQRTAGPIPMRQPIGPASRQARTRTGLMALAAAVAVVGVLGFGAVSTGLVHVPGMGPATQTAITTPAALDSVQFGDVDSKTIGASLRAVSTRLLNERGINSKQTDGLVIVRIEPRSPAEDAALQPNDIILAMDGVPIGNANISMWGTKTRMTPFGEKFRLTIERNGAIQEVPVAVGRCSIPTAQRPPNTVCPSAQIVK